MRIGLYGMPTAGKTFILNQIDFMKVFFGSKLLHEFDPDFDLRNQGGKEKVRKEIAKRLLCEDKMIMDGHYSFGPDVVFTEEDGALYDAILYLFIQPDVLRNRMTISEKNYKHLSYDVKEWQDEEICALRDYCHKNNKDFYVIDNPPANTFDDVSDVVKFIRDISEGYSCLSFAQALVKDILSKCSSDVITLFDGDKTLIEEDSSSVAFNYKTNIYDGNYYTGYQAWKQSRDFETVGEFSFDDSMVHYNQKVLGAITRESFILTSGHSVIWNYMAKRLKIGCYWGREMSAETKYYVTKLLQTNGKRIIAYGDGMNDYYMLRQADQGVLVSRKNGSISKSLRDKELGGLTIV